MIVHPADVLRDVGVDVVGVLTNIVIKKFSDIHTLYSYLMDQYAIYFIRGILRKENAPLC